MPCQPFHINVGPYSLDQDVHFSAIRGPGHGQSEQAKRLGNRVETKTQ